MDAEKIAKAGRDMQMAADHFGRTVGYLDEALRSFQASNEALIVSFKELLEADRQARERMMMPPRRPPGAMG